MLSLNVDDRAAVAAASLPEAPTPLLAGATWERAFEYFRHWNSREDMAVLTTNSGSQLLGLLDPDTQEFTPYNQYLGYGPLPMTQQAFEQEVPEVLEDMTIRTPTAHYLEPVKSDKAYYQPSEIAVFQGSGTDRLPLLMQSIGTKHRRRIRESLKHRHLSYTHLDSLSFGMIARGMDMLNRGYVKESGNYCFTVNQFLLACACFNRFPEEGLAVEVREDNEIRAYAIALPVDHGYVYQAIASEPRSNVGIFSLVSLVCEALKTRAQFFDPGVHAYMGDVEDSDYWAYKTVVTNAIKEFPLYYMGKSDRGDYFGPPVPPYWDSDKKDWVLM